MGRQTNFWCVSGKEAVGSERESMPTGVVKKIKGALRDRRLKSVERQYKTAELTMPRRKIQWPGQFASQDCFAN